VLADYINQILEKVLKHILCDMLQYVCEDMKHYNLEIILINSME
jgi:hypothetical protein